MGVSNEVGVFRVMSVSVSAPGSYKKGRRYDNFYFYFVVLE